MSGRLEFKLGLLDPHMLCLSAIPQDDAETVVELLKVMDLSFICQLFTETIHTCTHLHHTHTHACTHTHKTPPKYFLLPRPEI